MTTDENLSMTPDNDKAPQRRKRPRKGPIVGFLLVCAGIGAAVFCRVLRKARTTPMSPAMAVMP
ncbi:MAG: hypothetical protein ACLRWP_21400 [Bilophila wadsworthia]